MKIHYPFRPWRLLIRAIHKFRSRRRAEAEGARVANCPPPCVGGYRLPATRERREITGLASLAFLLLASAFGFPSPAPAASVTKDAMLQAMVRNVIRPDYQELAAKSQALTAAIQQLTNAPTPDSLAQARAAWLATVLAARQLQ